MLRAVRRACIPIWYTEGFNPHPFITFPLPISLGIDGKRECMDIRITDDEYDISLIPSAMNGFLPGGIQVFDATYPMCDPKLISYASYVAVITSDDMSGEELKNSIISLYNADSVVIQKKSKAGMKDVDVLPYIKKFMIQDCDAESCIFSVVLPAGNTKNIGLPLVLKAIGNTIGTEIDYNIVKDNMYDENMHQFE